jgi:hypothetical protein
MLAISLVVSGTPIFRHSGPTIFETLEILCSMLHLPTRRSSLKKDVFIVGVAPVKIQSRICWDRMLTIYLQVGGAFIICSRPDLWLGELKISTAPSGFMRPLMLDLLKTIEKNLKDKFETCSENRLPGIIVEWHHKA